MHLREHKWPVNDGYAQPLGTYGGAQMGAVLSHHVGWKARAPPWQEPEELQRAHFANLSSYGSRRRYCEVFCEIATVLKVELKGISFNLQRTEDAFTGCHEAYAHLAFASHWSCQAFISHVHDNSDYMFLTPGGNRLPKVRFSMEGQMMVKELRRSA